MKFVLPLVFAVAVTGFTALAAAEALKLDPAVVNAKTAHVKFENDRVRVLEAVLQPGDKGEVALAPRVRDLRSRRREDAQPRCRRDDVRRGIRDGPDDLPRAPDSLAENIGTTTVHVLLVELKQPR
jgi:hypothetical protein